MDLDKSLKIGAAVVGGIGALAGSFFLGKRYGQKLVADEFKKAAVELEVDLDKKITEATNRAIEKSIATRTAAAKSEIEAEMARAANSHVSGINKDKPVVVLH